MRKHGPSGCDLDRRTFAQLVGLAGIRAVGTGATAATATEEHVSVGSGGYTTTVPDDAITPPAPAYTTAALSAPYPTNEWWSRLLTVEHATPLFSHPLVTHPTASGLGVGYTDEWDVGDGTGVDMAESDAAAYTGMEEVAYTPFARDCTIGHTAAAEFERTLVDDYGDWHVEYRMEAADGSLRVTQAKGSPYLYLEPTGGSVTVSFDAAPTVFADRGNVLGVTAGGHQYGLFAPVGTVWEDTDSTTFTNPGGRYATIALLPDDEAATLDTFAATAHNVITDTELTWEYVETDGEDVVSEVRTTFSFTVADQRGEGGDETLTALYPHQHKYLHEADQLRDDLQYSSPRGTMKLVSGSSFTTALTYPGIVPHYPVVDSVDADTVEEYAAIMSTPDTTTSQFDGRLAAEYGVPTLSEASIQWSRLPYIPGESAPVRGSYWTGLNYNRWSEAVAILDGLGETDRRDLVLAVMQRSYGSWFQATTDESAVAPPLFFYDETWGSLVGYPGGFNSYAELNDHHFHYGYFVKGAAEIARHNESWAAPEQYGDMVSLLVREYANPTRDHDMFPFLRTFSPYAGHSYASGINPFQLGNNQESSSEAINAYAGLIRWGGVTGQTLDGHSIEELGIFLYTHEVHAALEYWHDWEGQNHPDDWEREYASVLWDSGYAHSTWWTENNEATYAINVLPATGGSPYLGWNRESTRTVYDELVSLVGSEDFTRWPGILLELGGFVDPSNALSLFEKWEGGEFPGETWRYVPDSSNSKLHTYTMLEALDTLGSPTPEIVSDATFSHVFVDGAGVKRYLAYNPDETTMTVRFSDGTTFEVGPGSFVVWRSEAADEPTATRSTAADGPGFGIGATLGGLGAAGYLLHRRFTDDTDESTTPR